MTYKDKNIMGLQKQLASLIQFLALSGGRDKACRVIQYFCKFLATKYQEQYEKIIHMRESIESKKMKSESLMGAMGMTRKVLRFGPSINCIKTVIGNLKTIASGKAKEPLIILILKTLSQFFLGVFFICDHYMWLYKVGLVKNEFLKSQMEFYSSFGWLLGCICDIIKNLILISTQFKSLKESKGLIIDLVRVVCDTPVAYSFVKPGSVNGKIVGLLGTLTSLIGIYQMWK